MKKAKAPPKQKGYAPKTKKTKTKAKTKTKQQPKTKGKTKQKDFSDDEQDGEERSGSMSMQDCRRFAIALQKSTGHKEHAGSLYALAWSIACLTGRRGADVRPLRLNDIKSDRIRIGNSKLAKKKGGRGNLKWVPIEPSNPTAKLITTTLAECRTRGMKEDDKVFHFGYEAFEKKIRQVRKGFKTIGQWSCPSHLITSHTPRRSLAGHLFREGVALSTIKQITGHQSSDTLTRYIQADYCYQRQAAGKVKF
eukprot:g1514.t1